MWDEICTVDTPIALMSGRPLKGVVVAASSVVKRYLYFVFVPGFNIVFFYNGMKNLVYIQNLNIDRNFLSCRSHSFC